MGESNEYKYNIVIQSSIILLKKVTGNMYSFDIQFKLWHSRIATNSMLYEMNILDSDKCKYCHEIENIIHAFVQCERVFVERKNQMVIYHKIFQLHS